MNLRTHLSRSNGYLLLSTLVGLLLVGCGKEKAEFEKLKRMAEIGNPYAQSAVGMMYAIGHGVAKDPVIGHAWYNIAITNGHEESKERIKDIKLNPKQLIEAQVMYDEIYKRIEAKGKVPTDPDRIYKLRNP